jgi:hypothetical protein
MSMMVGPKQLDEGHAEGTALKFGGVSPKLHGAFFNEALTLNKML